jgi:hypothetical protein
MENQVYIQKYSYSSSQLMDIALQLSLNHLFLQQVELKGKTSINTNFQPTYFWKLVKYAWHHEQA